MQKRQSKQFEIIFSWDGFLNLPANINTNPISSQRTVQSPTCQGKILPFLRMNGLITIRVYHRSIVKTKQKNPTCLKKQKHKS